MVTVNNLQALANLAVALQTAGLRYVGTRGNTDARLCLVGEGPGADEDQMGLPFVGSSGREQDKMLHEAGIRQDDLWFTNPYKTRPPDNKIERIDELGIPRDLFVKQFLEELCLYKPTIILTAGKTATNLLCPETVPKSKGPKTEKTEGFGKWRGSLLVSPLLPWPHYVIPIYHPAYVLRNWSERQVSVMIYKKAKDELDYFLSHGHLNPLPSYNIRFDPSYDETVEYMLTLLNEPGQVSIDIELLMSRQTKVKLVNIIGLARSPSDALVFTPWDQTDASRLVRLMRLTNLVLQRKRQIGQNYTTFDLHWLRSLGLRPNLDLVDDTLIRHNTLWPELPHSLAFMTIQYTRQPYYKDQGKVWQLGRANMNKVRHYCGLDVCTTFEIYNQQEKEF